MKRRPRFVTFDTMVRMAPRSDTAPEERAIRLDHPELDRVVVRIRRGRRTRHVRLHVDEHGDVTASIPARFAAARLDPIVRERADWLHEVLSRMASAARATEVDLERGDPVRWLDRWVPTRLARGGARPSVGMVDGVIELRVPEGDDPHDALLAWYRREARRIFEARVERWSSLFGQQPGRVSIREQRTRWGSCTHRGDLSFNWRLVLAPDWVLDSIVVHELCHIDELNHSSRFWALLDERYPRHAEASAWLQQHGSALRVTRPAVAGGAPATAEPRSVLRPPRRRRRRSGPGAEQPTLF